MRNIKLASALITMLSLPVTVNKPIRQEVQQSEYTSESFRKNFFDASRVYGRAGCGDVNLAELTARSAAKTGLPANVIAAEIAVESSCNPLAVSKAGAIGLTQVMPRVWAQEYNNFRDKNLLKTEDSIEVGMDILSRNVQEHGLRDGIRRYNGSGPEADAYAVKVMVLAGAK
jgi:soluble lytic murein transglycosylase-like protein